MDRVRILLALGAGELTAFLPGAGTVVSVPAGLEPGVDDPGPALALAFDRLEEALRGADWSPVGGPPGWGAAGVRMSVALLPSLCEVRLVPLPPLRPGEIRSVLRRDAARHFLMRARPLVVAGLRAASGDAPGVAPVLAAAASGTLLEALTQAVAARGWEVERIVPAHAAWLRALNAGGGSAGAAGASGGGSDAPGLVVAVEGDTAHVLRWAGPLPERIRRVPAGDSAAVLEAAGPGPGRVLLLAGEERGAGLAEALADRAWSPAAPGGSPASAAAEAARHAARVEPELVPASLARHRRERSRGMTARLFAAAVLLVAAAAAVHLWGTAREYRSVLAQREELRDAVAPALTARDSVVRMQERLEDLETLGRASARWTFALVELAMVLPPETHLVSLRAAGDTVVVEAEGGRAGDALAALRGAPTLADVRIEGVIQRDLEAGATSRERFTLSALLAAPARHRALQVGGGGGGHGEGGT